MPCIHSQVDGKVMKVIDEFSANGCWIPFQLDRAPVATIAVARAPRDRWVSRLQPMISITSPTRIVPAWATVA